jgi:polyisoprenoid-binding protein YceI
VRERDQEHDRPRGRAPAVSCSGFAARLVDRGMTRTLLMLATLAAQAPAAAAGTGDPLLQVAEGTVTFEVATNIPALRVHGKSTAVRANVRAELGTRGIAISEIDATVPVVSLKTGLALRDDHMRHRVFTDDHGRTPDLRFVGERFECSPAAAQRSACRVEGTLHVRGVTRPFAIALVVKDDRGVFRVSGSGTVRLSDYGIDRPSQLGVTTADDVALTVDLVVRAVARQVAKVRS